jgi:hypothetical protein
MSERFPFPRQPIEDPLESSRLELPATTESVVFVDVGAKRIEPQILRDGVPVGVFEVDPQIFDPIVAGSKELPLKVFSQKIAPGTSVTLGTAVDITMTVAEALPVGVIAGTHIAVKELQIDQAFQQFVAGKPQVNRIVARAAAGPLSPEDEAAVRELFTAEGVEITDQPGRDVDAAVEVLRVLTIFGS